MRTPKIARRGLGRFSSNQTCPDKIFIDSCLIYYKQIKDNTSVSVQIKKRE